MISKSTAAFADDDDKLLTTVSAVTTPPRGTPKTIHCSNFSFLSLFFIISANILPAALYP
jgi:hypothetical protein